MSIKVSYSGGSTKIQFDEQEISKNTRTILQASTSTEAKAIQESYKIIIDTAKIFNLKYEQMVVQINTFENQLKECIKNWHDTKQSLGADYKSSILYQNYLKDRARIRAQHWDNKIQTNVLNTYNLAMQFQEYLNAALGQLVATVYTWTGRANVPETYIIHDMSNFLKTDIDRYGNVTVKYRNNIQMLRNHAQKIENLINTMTNDNFDYNSLLNAYTEVSNRFSTYDGRVLWLNPEKVPKWHGFLISSMGTIKERYATLLLEQHFNPTSIPEDDIEQFMGVKVTNLAGSLQGDTHSSAIIENENLIRTMQAAIKSKGAATLSIKQLYDISTYIINAKLNNFEAICNYLKNKKAKNKSIEAPIDKNLHQIIQNIADTDLQSVMQQTFNASI